MTIENNAAEPAAFPAEVQTQLIERGIRGAEKSWFEVDAKLAMVLANVFGPNDEDEDGEVAITLVTQGAVITGVAVSEVAWEKALLDLIRRSSEPTAKSVEDRFTAVRNGKADQQDAILANPLRRSQTRFIHFIEATVIQGRVRIALQPTRVDLRDVSTWSLGSIGAAES